MDDLDYAFAHDRLSKMLYYLKFQVQGLDPQSLDRDAVLDICNYWLTTNTPSLVVNVSFQSFAYDLKMLTFDMAFPMGGSPQTLTLDTRPFTFEELREEGAKLSTPSGAYVPNWEEELPHG